MRITSLKRKIKKTMDIVSRDINCEILLTDNTGSAIISNREALETGLFNPETDKSSIEIGDQNVFHLYIRTSPENQDGEYSLKTIFLLRNLIKSQILSEFEIQNLSQEILDKYEELNLIYDIISELKTVFDEKEICRIILKKALQIIPVRFGVIILINPIHFVPEFISLYGIGHDFSTEEQLVLLDLTNNSILQKRVDFSKNPSCIRAEFSGKFNLKNEPQLISVPLITGDEIFGVMALIDKADNTDFTSIDIKLLSALTGQAGDSIRSSRLIHEMKESEALRREMEIAHDIQMSLIPRFFPKDIGLDIAGICIPSAYAGGDFFSYDEFGKDEIMFSIADVCGHGLSSSFIMVSLRSILRSEINWSGSLKKCIEQSNSALFKDTGENEKYATLMALSYNKKQKSVRFVDAGHLPPVYWNNKNRCLEEIIIEKGFPLGMFDDNVYIEKEFFLNRGDVILLYTDGITEARNEKKEYFGEKKLKNIISKNNEKDAAEISQIILDMVRSFQEGTSQNDDITLMVIKVI